MQLRVMILWRSEEGGSERCRNRSHERRWSGFRLHRAASAGRVRPITHSTSIFAHSEFCSVACWVDTPCSLAPINMALNILVGTHHQSVHSRFGDILLTNYWLFLLRPAIEKVLVWWQPCFFVRSCQVFPIVLYYRKNTEDDKQRKWKTVSYIRGLNSQWPALKSLYSHRSHAPPRHSVLWPISRSRQSLLTFGSHSVWIQQQWASSLLLCYLLSEILLPSPPWPHIVPAHCAVFLNVFFHSLNGVYRGCCQPYWELKDSLCNSCSGC